MSHVLDIVDLLLSEVLSPSDIASKPPRWITDPKHKEVWHHVVTKHGHTNYGSATNHFKNHMAKHGGKIEASSGNASLTPQTNQPATPSASSLSPKPSTTTPSLSSDNSPAKSTNGSTICPNCGGSGKI